MVHWEVDVPLATQRALEALSLLSGKWQPVVLVVLAHRDTAGFNDLLDAVPGISGKVLSDVLDGLQEAGLVERRVRSESPLRVEYELTEAGEDIQCVFDELAAWGDQHLESTVPVVLVAENDRRITKMYSEWLADHYVVVRAHDREELEAMLDESLDGIVFAQDFTAVDPASVVSRTPSGCRAILLVEDRPGFDILDVQCDDVLCKPLVRETVLEAVDRQLSRRGEPQEKRELAALSTKRDRLEQCYSAEELTTSDLYTDICARLDELEAEIADK